MAYIENPRPLLKCQYWIIDEPSVCVHWNADASMCIYEKVTVINNTNVIQRGALYPLCNYIGTAKTLCLQYEATINEDDGTDITPRCILPDPYRHISRAPNCGKWVVPTTTSGITDPLDFSPIEGYNDGNCDYTEADETSGGTDNTCTGYTPQHLGFSGKPALGSCTVSGISTPTVPTTPITNPIPTPTPVTSTTTKHLPLSYDIFNKRAELGKCMWWDSYDTKFIMVDAVDITPAHIEPPEFKCTNTSDEVKDFADFYKDTVEKYTRAPCNGATPDCPKYTGNLASAGYLPFLSSVFVRHGDKVMAEQVLELRYNIKKATWDPAKYELLFGDASSIYAHTGAIPEVIKDTEGNILDYSMAAINVSIATFDCLTFARTPILLTKGTPTENNKVDFPTLIEEIGELPLSPIIHSVFETQWEGSDEGLSFTQTTEYVFETPYADHEDLLLVGDHFSETGEQKTIFAINISDEEIAFPLPSLYKFSDMFEYRAATGKNFILEHDKLKCYFTVLKDIAPDKLYYNTFTKDNRAFLINVKTIFGKNKIMVFDVSRDIYHFDTIEITKYYCGGVVAQTGFAVSSPDREISDHINYEFLNGHPLFNPELSYKFEALHSSNGGRTLPYHSYIDTKIVHLKAPLDMSTNSHYVLGYKMYKIKVLSNFIATNCDTTTYSKIVLLGNDGHMLVVIDDKLKLHSVIRNWDNGEVDDYGNSLPMEITLVGKDAYGKDQSIEMSIVEYCSDRLEVNQLIIKPKNPNDYVRLYGFAINFGDLYVYERWSFGLEPEGDFEEIRDGWAIDDVVSRANTTLEGSIESNEYTIKNPPIAPIIAAVIYKGGVTLRIKGQAKTDLMNWVKQPFCSDVEISYNWSASYRSYTLLPTHYCFVSNIGVSYTPANTGEGPSYPIRQYSPYCGDHGFGRVSTRPAAMWYPYTSCDEYASYSIYAGSGEYDPAPMDFWVNKNGKYVGSDIHNSNDLRMLGPASHFGITTDVHTSIWACSCDWTHMNLEMTGTPWFSGWAKIRSGVEGAAYELMTQNGGEPPKFGNKRRGYLASFRSTAYLTYYELGNQGDVAVKYKWLPPYEGFSDLRLDKSFQDYPWKHYFNTGDNVATYMSQFGLLAANNVDGETVSEHLVRDDTPESNLARYRFTDIFSAHHTLVGTRYPEPQKPYYVGLNLKPVTAWLTYKDYLDDSSLAIQWAWRERWKTLERGKPDIRNILMDIPLTECDSTDYNMLYLSFLGFNYPNYTYDYRISEFRRVASEGFHVVHWEPSIFDPENPLPTYFALWMDDGPTRLLDPECKLVKDPAEINSTLKFTSVDIDTLIADAAFYDFCSGGDWLNNITCDFDIEDLEKIEDSAEVSSSDNFMLYTSSTIVTETEEAAITNAIEDEREIITSDGSGEEVKRYFNRGLVLNIKQDMLQYLPRVDKLIDMPYEFNLSVPSHDESQFSIIVPLEYYPASENFGMIYNGLLNSEVTLVFKFSIPTIISKIEVFYNKGEIVEDSDANIRTYYNIPKVSVGKSTDGQIYTELVSDDFSFGDPGAIPTVEMKTYDIDDSDLVYMSSLYSFLNMSFTYAPTIEDLTKHNREYSPDFTHLMDIRVIKLYTIEYSPLTEILDTYERKFNISVGSCGDIPIHGHDYMGSLLYPNPWELSTVYQQDNSLGMIGAPGWVGVFNSISKIRSRRAQQLRVDPEILAGNYSDFEGKQKELYDEVALSGSDTITMSSIAREILKEALSNTKVNVFPMWACTLENKNMVPLKAVPQKSKYYPLGHHWTWGLDNVRDFYNCGGGGIRKWTTLFDYKWGRLSGVYGYGYDTDAVFDLYTYAVSKAMSWWSNQTGISL